MIFQSQNLSLAEFVQYASPEQLAERRDEIVAHLSDWQKVKDVIDDRVTYDVEDYADEVEEHSVKQCDYDELERSRGHLLKRLNDMQAAKTLEVRTGRLEDAST